MPAPAVVVTALNDHNVAMTLQAWIREKREHVRLRNQLREDAFEALRSAGVDMPYNTHEVRSRAA